MLKPRKREPKNAKSNPVPSSCGLTPDAEPFPLPCATPRPPPNHQPTHGWEEQHLISGWEGGGALDLSEVDIADVATPKVAEGGGRVGVLAEWGGAQGGREVDEVGLCREGGGRCWGVGPRREGTEMGVRERQNLWCSVGGAVAGPFVRGCEAER